MGGRYRSQEYEPRPTLGEMAAARNKATNAISIQLEINQKKYWGFLNPAAQQLQPGFPESFELYFWGEYQGTIAYAINGWYSSKDLEQEVIDKVGEYIFGFYQ